MAFKGRLTAMVATVVLLYTGIFFATAQVSGGGAAGKTTITWWAPDWNEAVARELVKKFQAENPDLHVKMVITTWDTMANKIRVTLDSGNHPDLITELESRTRLYAKRGQLSPLDELFGDELPRDDFVPSSLEAVSYENATYSMPIRHDTAAVIYNADMLAEAGITRPPSTWEEFVDAAETLTKDTDGDGTPEQYGLAWPLGNADNAVTRFVEQLLTNGGTFTDASGAPTLDSRAAVTALDNLASHVTRGIAPASSLELDNTAIRNLFINERVAMYVGGAYDTEPALEAGINVGTMQYPGLGGPGVTTADGFGLMVPSGAEHPDAAKKLIKFMARPEHMARLTLTLPARRSAAEAPRFSDELLAPFLEQLETSAPLPPESKNPDLQRAIYAGMQEVVLGETDPRTAVERIQRQAEQILADQS